MGIYWPREESKYFFRNIRELSTSDIGIDQDQVSGAVWSPVLFWILPDPEVDLSLLEQSHCYDDAGSSDMNQLKDNYMQIFKDGSKDPASGRAGFALYVADLQILQSV